MIYVSEYYKEVNVNGVSIVGRRGLKGNEESGVLEVIEIIGRKDGVYKGKDGKWRKGTIFATDIYTYREAMTHWQIANLRKFGMVVN